MDLLGRGRVKALPGLGGTHGLSSSSTRIPGCRTDCIVPAGHMQRLGGGSSSSGSARRRMLNRTTYTHAQREKDKGPHRMTSPRSTSAAVAASRQAMLRRSFQSLKELDDAQIELANLEADGGITVRARARGWRGKDVTLTWDLCAHAQIGGDTVTDGLCARGLVGVCANVLSSQSGEKTATVLCGHTGGDGRRC
jgi:hypothetical protein